MPTVEHHPKRRLAEGIADDIQETILGQNLPVGHRLPSEPDLMSSYGVSRTAIREAARILTQRGLVSVSSGRGMTVTEIDGSAIAAQFSVVLRATNGTFDQLLELRRALEVQVARTTAESCPPETLIALDESIEEMQSLVDSESVKYKTSYLEADMKFHTALLDSSPNPFLRTIALPIVILLKSHYSNRSGYPTDAKRTLSEHKSILEAIRSADTFNAYLATETHLTRLISKWRSMPISGVSDPSGTGDAL